MPLKVKQYKLDVDGDKKFTRIYFMIFSKNSKKKKKNGFTVIFILYIKYYRTEKKNKKKGALSSYKYKI